MQSLRLARTSSLALLCALALSLLAAAPVRALENTTALEFTDSPHCASPSDDCVCFYEKANYKGKCACSKLEPAFEDIKLGNGGAYASVRVPTHKRLVLNVFLDDYDRNSKSIETSCADTPGIARRFTVGTRDSVCLYTQPNFHGEKLCIQPGPKRHHCVDGFASVLFFPTSNPRVKAHIKDDQCRTASARALGKETDLDKRRYDILLKYTNNSSSETTQKQSAR